MRLLLIFTISFLTCLKTSWSQNAEIIQVKNISSGLPSKNHLLDLWIHYTLPPDSLLEKQDFYFKIKFKQKDLGIKAGNGWSHFSDNDNELCFHYNIGLHKTNHSDSGFINIVSIPISAMDLPSGENQIDIEISLLSQREGIFQLMDVRYINSQLIKVNEKFLCHIKIDHVEATILDAKGRGWDYTLSGSKAAPDIKINILINGYPVWTDYQKDVYLYKNNLSNQAIVLQVNKNDLIELEILDIDPIGFQKIGKSILILSSKNLDNWIYLPRQFDNVKSCQMAYKFSNKVP